MEQLAFLTISSTTSPESIAHISKPLFLAKSTYYS